MTIMSLPTTENTAPPPDAGALAFVLSRMDVDLAALFEPGLLPGETLEEFRGRRAAGPDIVDELLVEYSAELATAEGVAA